MDPITQKRRRRGRYLFWSLVALLVLVPIGGVLYATFGPNPPILVSKATTHITTPLADDGLPDYAAALLADMRKGVTPENNGAVLFLQAMWPADDDPDNAITPEDGKLLCKELGLTSPPPSSERIGTLQSDENRLGVLRLLRQMLPAAKPGETPNLDEFGFGLDGEFADHGISTNDTEALQDWRVDHVLWGCDPVSRPWTAKDIPYLATWFEDRDAEFEKLIQAASCPRWYLPNPEMLRGSRGTLMSSMPSIQPAREAMRHLQSRSYLRLGEGNLQEAFRNSVAITQLGRLLYQGPFLVDRLVGNAIENVSYHLLYRLIDAANADAATMRQVLAEIDAIGPCPSLLDGVSQGERYFALDATISNYLQGIAAPIPTDDLGGVTVPETPLDRVRGIANGLSLDWNKTLIALNQHFDRLEAATQLTGRVPKLNAITNLEADFNARHQSFSKAIANPLRLLTSDSRSQLVSDATLAEMGFSYSYYLSFTDRNQLGRDLLRLQLALAIYRAEEQAYPKTIEAVVPEILPKLPTDPYGNAYAYRRTDDGFLLYSLGENGIDDGGSHENELYFVRKFEGIAIDDLLDDDPDTLTPEDRAVYDLIEKIPPGADDVSLRVPLPVDPWPWEE